MFNDNFQLCILRMYIFGLLVINNFMKVYFNNSCKICKAEIDLYKKEKIEEIDWIDITDNKIAQKETSKNSKELLRRLHVKDGEKVLARCRSFFILWKKMPKYKFLYNFFKLPIIFNFFHLFMK